jgi:hypothetical protein
VHIVPKGAPAVFRMNLLRRVMVDQAFLTHRTGPGVSYDKKEFSLLTIHHALSLRLKITYDAGRFRVPNAHWHPASLARLVYYRAPKQCLNPPRRNTD